MKKAIFFSIMVMILSQSALAAEKEDVSALGVNCNKEGAVIRAEFVDNAWMRSVPVVVDGMAATCLNGKVVVDGKQVSEDQLMQLKAKAIQQLKVKAIHADHPKLS